jgi:hypothetical protein
MNGQQHDLAAHRARRPCAQDGHFSRVVTFVGMTALNFLERQGKHRAGVEDADGLGPGSWSWSSLHEVAAAPSCTVALRSHTGAL